MQKRGQSDDVYKYSCISEPIPDVKLPSRILVSGEDDATSCLPLRRNDAHHVDRLPRWEQRVDQFLVKKQFADHHEAGSETENHRNPWERRDQEDPNGSSHSRRWNEAKKRVRMAAERLAAHLVTKLRPIGFNQLTQGTLCTGTRGPGAALRQRSGDEVMHTVLGCHGVLRRQQLQASVLLDVALAALRRLNPSL